MAFDKNLSAGYLINHLARLFGRALTKEISAIGLTTGTFPVLLELWEDDGRTQKELVAALNIEQATMANTLTRMERDGLIRRDKDAHDGRVQRIWVTEHARLLRDQAHNAANAVNAQVLSPLTADERSVFIAMMQKLVADAHSTAQP